ncbi:MAG: DNA polymerase III subunit delta [Thermodesulfobacteriota bacterium]|nr:DNA polymerase III subunit delta [Thermodesulfobacteriota bacterium]
MGSLTGDTTRTLDAVLRDIKKGDIAPCYLIHGDEEYLVKDGLDKIISLLLPGESRDLNLFYMDGENEDVDIVCESILTPPLIPGKKVVAVRNSRFFHSKTTLPDLIKKIVKNSEDNPLEAARAFVSFLKTAGWSLEDLRDDGWKKISDDEWSEKVGSDSGEGREKWLPKMVDFCDSHGINVGRSQEDTQVLVDALISGLPEGNCLILTADYSVDRRKKLFKTISDIGVVLGFSRVKGEKRQKKLLMDTAEELLGGSGKELTPKAFLAMERKTGFNLRQFRGALEKLITYTGDRPTITEQDIEDVTGKTKEDSIFDLTSALTEKNLGKALLTLKELLDQGVHHLMILAMIIREIRLLLHAKIFLKSGKLSAFYHEMDYNRFQKTIYPDIKEYKKGNMLAGQHPYVIYNALKNSRGFSYKEIAGHFETLVDVDIALKTTGKDPRLMLERLLTDICL